MSTAKAATNQQTGARRGAKKINFLALLKGSEPIGGLDAVNAVRAGYHAHILKEVSVYFNVPEARIQRLAHISSSTVGRLLKQDGNIDSAVSERVLRISNVTRFAIDTFGGDVEAAKDWLRQPNIALQESAPLDLLDTEPGAATVRQILNAIAMGGAV